MLVSPLQYSQTQSQKHKKHLTTNSDMQTYFPLLQQHSKMIYLYSTLQSKID